jgi:hypothetical protein
MKIYQITHKDIVTYLLKAGIAEPEERTVPRERFCKHVSTATNLRDRSVR